MKYLKVTYEMIPDHCGIKCPKFLEVNIYIYMSHTIDGDEIMS